MVSLSQSFSFLAVSGLITALPMLPYRGPIAASLPAASGQQAVSSTFYGARTMPDMPGFNGIMSSGYDDGSYPNFDEDEEEDWNEEEVIFGSSDNESEKEKDVYVPLFPHSMPIPGSDRVPSVKEILISNKAMDREGYPLDMNGARMHPPVARDALPMPSNLGNQEKSAIETIDRIRQRLGDDIIFVRYLEARNQDFELETWIRKLQEILRFADRLRSSFKLNSYISQEHPFKKTTFEIQNRLLQCMDDSLTSVENMFQFLHEDEAMFQEYSTTGAAFDNIRSRKYKASANLVHVEIKMKMPLIEAAFKVLESHMKDVANMVDAPQDLKREWLKVPAQTSRPIDIKKPSMPAALNDGSAPKRPINMQ